MAESVRLDTLPCDFMSRAEFARLLEMWLMGERGHHVVTLNPEMVVLAHRDPAFRAAASAADRRVPDGAGLVWARWYLRSALWSLWPSLLVFPFVEVERVTGVDAVADVARACAARTVPLYLLGGTPAQVELTAARLQECYPTLTASSAPPHRYDESGPPSILEHIRHAAPHVLLVAYGAPAQTLWIHRHLKSLPSVRIALGVGGAFAMLSEQAPRAPHLLRRYNLEWLWRLLLEPSRVGRIREATITFPRLMQAQKQRAAARP